MIDQKGKPMTVWGAWGGALAGKFPDITFRTNAQEAEAGAASEPRFVTAKTLNVRHEPGPGEPWSKSKIVDQVVFRELVFVAPSEYDDRGYAYLPFNASLPTTAKGGGYNPAGGGVWVYRKYLSKSQPSASAKAVTPEKKEAGGAVMKKAGIPPAVIAAAVAFGLVYWVATRDDPTALA